MKRTCFLNGAALAALLIAAPVAFSPMPAAAQGQTTSETTTTVSVENFRERLTPVGEYIRVEGLGDVWKPRDVGADWQPYSNGRWIFNDKVGWYFDSMSPGLKSPTITAGGMTIRTRVGFGSPAPIGLRPGSSGGVQAVRRVASASAGERSAQGGCPFHVAHDDHRQPRAPWRHRNGRGGLGLRAGRADRFGRYPDGSGRADPRDRNLRGNAADRPG